MWVPKPYTLNPVHRHTLWADRGLLAVLPPWGSRQVAVRMPAPLQGLGFRGERCHLISYGRLQVAAMAGAWRGQVVATTAALAAPLVAALLGGGSSSMVADWHPHIARNCLCERLGAYAELVRMSRRYAGEQPVQSKNHSA